MPPPPPPPPHSTLGDFLYHTGTCPNLTLFSTYQINAGFILFSSPLRHHSRSRWEIQHTAEHWKYIGRQINGWQNTSAIIIVPCPSLVYLTSRQRTWQMSNFNMIPRWGKSTAPGVFTHTHTHTHHTLIWQFYPRQEEIEHREWF